MTPPIFRQRRLRLSQTLHPPLLEGFVGDWEMEISNASFLPRPSDKVKGGPVLIEWATNHRIPQALWLINRDDSTLSYSVLYYDARSVSRVYDMSFSGMGCGRCGGKPQASGSAMRVP